MPESEDLLTIQVSAEQLGLLMHILANIDTKLGALDLVASRLGGVEDAMLELTRALRAREGRD